MKRLLLALALSFALIAPAQAASITQIIGSGTGGNIGSSTVGSGGLTLSLTTNVTVPIGGFIVVGILQRSSGGSPTGCSDSAGNTYSISAQTFNTNVGAAICYAPVTTALSSGGTITMTHSSTSPAKAIQAAAFNNVVSSSPLDGAVATATASSTAIGVGPTGTLACQGGSVTACELIFTVSSIGNLGTITESSGFTSLGDQPTNASGHFAFELVGATTPVTYAATNTLSGTLANQMAAFKAALGGGAAVCTRALLGVGC